MSSCCERKTFFANPLDAFKHGSREKLLYVTCINSEKPRPDYLAVIDVDPNSNSYCQVINRLYMPHVGDELHHFGWNACASCVGGDCSMRSHLILQCLHSSRVYAVNVLDDPKNPKIDKEIDLKPHGLTFPHTSHCLPNGSVLISCLGDEADNGSGSFVLLDSKTLEVQKTWGSKRTAFGYDYWYQPRLDVMISTEWGAPKCIKTGLNIEHVKNGSYGSQIHVWQWSTGKHLQTLDLGVDGCMPLEIRFMHNPDSQHGFVACALGSSVFHFYKNKDDQWTADKVIQAKSLPVEGWALPEMPACYTDFLISLDDKFMYISAWLHGYVEQYDIQDPFHPKLVGRVNVGGSLIKSGHVTVNDKNFEQPEALVIKGCKVEGAAQMMQLSLDGKRLFVTNSLYSIWDKQFYPDMVKNGSCMIQIDADVEKGGLKVNQDFLINFGNEPDGPVLAHEMRYPGGDCTSDIWV